jgi:hypothetical protein
VNFIDRFIGRNEKLEMMKNENFDWLFSANAFFTSAV